MATFLEPKDYKKEQIYSVGNFIVTKDNEDKLEYFMNIKPSRNDGITDEHWWVLKVNITPT